MGGLNLRLLGRFQLARPDGGALHVPDGKPRALLGCLAWRPGKARTRGNLAALLWSGRPEDSARHNLNQALTTLRRAAGEGVVRSDGEQLYLDPAAIEVDAVRLRTLARHDDAASGVEAESLAARGTFLEGLEIAEPEFEDWLAQARAELEEVRDALYASLLERALADGDGRRASELAGLLVGRDPLNETGHRGLMRAHALQGHPSRALRQFATCRHRLARELEVEPDEATRSLAQEIQNHDFPGSSTTEPPSPDTTADPPLVAILPFAGFASTNPVRHIADSMTHSLIIELSRFRSVRVVAKDTAFRLASLTADARVAARELGASYAVCGSLDSVPDGLRVEARLVDAHSGVHLWGERYDVAHEEFFDVRDDIIASIVGTAAPVVERERLRQALHKPTSSWNAWDCYARAGDIYFRHWSAPVPPPECQPLLERAVERDPEFARAYALMACTTAHAGKGDAIDEDFSVSIGHARRAMALDPRDAQAPRVIGAIYTCMGRFEEAYHHLWNAVRINPNDADLALHRARYHALAGAPERAFEPFERARKLNPLHPGWYWCVAATAHHLLGNYGDALAALNRMDHKTFVDHLYAAACYAELGERTQAYRAMQRALAEQPGLTRSTVARYTPYRDPADREYLLRGLAMAGMRQ